MATNITGTSGNDRLNFQPADPTASVNITGLEGNDTLYGSTNSDTLFGNPGNDIILGGGGPDSIYGGQGDDTISVVGNSPTTTVPAADVRSLVVGGLGRDNISVSNTFSFAQIPVLGTVLTNPNGAFTGQVTVYGGNEANDAADDADRISVSLGVNSSADIYGNAGNDTITVSSVGRSAASQVAANFEIYGGRGNDSIFGSVGTASKIVGGLDADVINISATDSVMVYGGNGTDDAGDGSDVITVSLSRDAQSSVNLVPTADIYGNGGNDVIELNTGSTAALAKIYGGRGGDSIEVNGAGLASNSYVSGGLGSDTIDVDVAGTGVSIVGGNGTEDPTDGRDSITVYLETAASSATVFGNGGDDVIRFEGFGSATAFGGMGDDTFNVGPSGDELASVVLTGGMGSDVYYIDVDAVDSNAPIVRITDFNFDEDRIGGTDAESLRVIDQSVTSLADLKGVAAQATASTAVLINVQSGAFAGTYLAYSNAGSDQLINITGYTGTADSDVFVQTTI